MGPIKEEVTTKNPQFYVTCHLQKRKVFKGAFALLLQRHEILFNGASLYKRVGKFTGVVGRLGHWTKGLFWRVLLEKNSYLLLPFTLTPFT